MKNSTRKKPSVINSFLTYKNSICFFIKNTTYLTICPKKVLNFDKQIVKFFSNSGYISPYSPTWVIMETLSISKSDTSSIVLPDWAILEKFIFCIAQADVPIFSIIHPAHLGQYFFRIRTIGGIYNKIWLELRELSRAQPIYYRISPFKSWNGHYPIPN